MKNVYIAAAKRTAIGSFNGSLSGMHPSDFAATVIKSILLSTNIPPEDINEVIAGNILSAGLGQGPARQSAIKAGIPETVPAYSVNMLCGSGMKAIMNAYVNIASGIGDLYIAGGTENMSMAPYIIPNARQGLRLGHSQVLDHAVLDALTDSFSKVHMGITAENIAEKYNITREAQDQFSYTSQQKAIAAIDRGAFIDEIVPIEVTRKRESFVFDIDEYPNRNTNMKKLSQLKPSFKHGGTVTAGNASGINDGAAFCLIASAEAIERHNLKPLAEICSIGQSGIDPQFMGLGPVQAIKNALQKVNLKLSDMDILELNEAFAAQSLGVIKELSLAYGMSEEEITSITNPNGGAIALGHPVGASGARIVTSLVHEMNKASCNLGLASLCIGGGMGTAVVLKKV